jgi:hypothetical protein
VSVWTTSSFSAPGISVVSFQATRSIATGHARNRVATVETPGQTVEDSDEELAFTQVFDLGDEVADAENAMERGDDFPQKKTSDDRKSQADIHEEMKRRRSAQIRANRSQITKAVLLGDRVLPR